MSQNLSSAVVVIGTLRVKRVSSENLDLTFKSYCFYYLKGVLSNKCLLQIMFGTLTVIYVVKGDNCSVFC